MSLLLAALLSDLAAVAAASPEAVPWFLCMTATAAGVWLHATQPPSDEAVEAVLLAAICGAF